MSKVSENIPYINQISQPSTVPKEKVTGSSWPRPWASQWHRKSEGPVEWLLKREMYIHMHGSTHVCTQAHIHGRSLSTLQAAYISVLFLCPPIYAIFWRLVHLLFDHAFAPLTALSSMVVESQIPSVLPPSSHVAPAQLPPTAPQHSPAWILILTLFLPSWLFFTGPKPASNPSSNCKDWLDLLLRRCLPWLSMSLHMVHGPALPSSS